MLKPFVGTYEFKYMDPDVEYVFYISLPDEDGTGREIYRLTKSIDDKPLDRKYENDGKPDGWTHSFVAERPAAGEIELDQEGHMLHYKTKKLIDFGVIKAGTSLLNGVIWDDSSDETVGTVTADQPYDGIRGTGYKGIANEEVELYAYAWKTEEPVGGHYSRHRMDPLWNSRRARISLIQIILKMRQLQAMQGRLLLHGLPIQVTGSLS